MAPAVAGSKSSAGSLATAGRAAGGSAALGGAGTIATSAGAGGVAPGAVAGASGAPPSAAGSSAAGAGVTAGSGGGLPTGGSAGAAAPGGDMVADCGEGGMLGKASNAGGAQGGGSGGGHVRMTFSSSNQILRLVTTMETPVKPNGNSTLFLWPGLEPLQGSPHYSPIGTGVLQPVMTWGGSCAPGSQPRSSWWISAQYVNTLGNEPGFTGCKGGAVMALQTGDKVLIDMSLKGAVWNQTLTNMNGGKSVDFDMDLKMQEQRWAMFEIEIPTSTKPAADVVFTNTVITLQKPEPKSCQPTRSGNDYYSAPISSADGLRCCYARIVLRAPGVTATTMDPAP